MDTKQFLRSILDSLQQIDYVKPEDVPNIDLYMDQVTTFMDSQLAASKRHDDDKILTKTMIKKQSSSSTGEKEVYQRACTGPDLYLLSEKYFKHQRHSGYFKPDH